MRTVAVLAYPGMSPFHLSVPCLVLGERRHPARRVAAERVTIAVPQAVDGGGRLVALVRAEQLAKRDVAFAADDSVDPEGRVEPLLRRQARIVPADDDSRFRSELSNKLDDAPCGDALERHDGQADDVRLVLTDETRDGLWNRRLDQDEIGDRDAVVRIDVARERRQGAVGHPDRERRRVLERVGHREQQDVHMPLKTIADRRT